VEQGDVGESGGEIGTRGTQVHVPSVEDRYILLAIVVIGSRRTAGGGSCVCLGVPSSGAPACFTDATRLGFTSYSRVFFLVLQVSMTCGI
jgi:hypothetical protein